MAPGKITKMSKITQENPGAREVTQQNILNMDPFDFDDMSETIGYPANEKKLNLNHDSKTEIDKFKYKQPAKKCKIDYEDTEMMHTGQYRATPKKAKVEQDTGVGDVLKKVQSFYDKHQIAWNQLNESICKRISEVAYDTEGDYEAMEENEKDLEQTAATIMEYINPVKEAFKNRAMALNERSSKNQCKQVEAMVSSHRECQNQLIVKLDTDFKNLKDTMDKYCKRVNQNNLRRKFAHVFQNDE